mmetsp:Transcript_52299/g.111369  ORF Transcript_52299/g.111369 Transcript_52299/m.111369 type:complete len:377 (+) Transcript_52299:147-1277(+)
MPANLELIIHLLGDRPRCTSNRPSSIHFAKLRMQQELVAILVLAVTERHRQRVRVLDVLCLTLLQSEGILLQEHRGDQLRFEDGHVHTQANSRTSLEDGKLVGWRRFERDPALRLHCLWLGVHSGIAAQAVGMPNHRRTLRHLGPVRKDIVHLSDFSIGWHWREESQGLVEHPVEVRHVAGRQALEAWTLVAALLLLDLFNQFLLYFWVDAEDVEHPRQCAGRGVTASDDKVQDHVSKVLVGELLTRRFGVKEECQQILSILQVGVLATALQNPTGLLVQDLQGLAEIAVFAAETPVETPAEAAGASKRPWQVLQEHQCAHGRLNVVHHGSVSSVISVSIDAHSIAHGVSILSEEYASDAIHGESEEQLLKIDSLA